MALSELEIKMMAKSAASDYIDKQIPLNTTLSKLASTHEMNGHHIARLVEETNLDAYSKMYKQAGNGNFTIDLADQNKIVDSVKTAGVRLPDDYDMTYSDINALCPKVASSTSMEKFAEMSDAPKDIPDHRILKTMSKLAHYVGELDSAVFEAEVETGNTIEKLADIIKHATLLGEDPSKAYIAALTVTKNDHQKELVKQAFVSINTKLNKFGIDIVKIAKEINEDSKGNATAEQSKTTTDTNQPFIVNHEHPIVKHINTITHNDELIQKARQQREHAVTEIRILGGKLKDKPFVTPDYDKNL